MALYLAPSPAFNAIGDAEFDALMAALNLPSSPSIAVATSGGPDSTALTHLLQRWSKAHGARLIALTVDHRLRENSSAEAASLGERLGAQNIPHRILVWDHNTPPQTGIHATARKARYDLLLEACRAEGASHLFLAHHAEDQAETILMRLSKSTGIDGLAGMALMREQDGITLCRPLLGIRKARLEATCAEAKLETLQDPSNAAQRFQRAQLRSQHESLAHAGFTVEKMGQIAAEAGAARAQLEAACNNWLSQHGNMSLYGEATLALEPWRMLDEPMRHRILARALVAVSGSQYPPRGGSLNRLAAELMTNAKRQTLGGCNLAEKNKTLHITREAGLITDEAPLSVFTPTRRWDDRFILTIDPAFNRTGLMVKKLGAISRQELMEKDSAIAALPAAIRAAYPAIFRNSKLFCLPKGADKALLLPSQTPLTACFSPSPGFLIKPFIAASFRMA